MGLISRGLSWHGRWSQRLELRAGLARAEILAQCFWLMRTWRRSWAATRGSMAWADGLHFVGLFD